MAFLPMRIRALHRIRSGAGATVNATLPDQSYQRMAESPGAELAMMKRNRKAKVPPGNLGVSGNGRALPT
jgi:hypothetical protein